MGAPKSVIKSLKPAQIASTGPFAHVTHTEGPASVIFTSGMVGQTADGSISDSYVEQIKQSLVNLKHCLEASGATVKDVLKLTYYIVNYDPNNRPHAALIFDWLEGHRPATALVPVPYLANPKFLFEIEAVAAVRNPALATPISLPQAGRVDDFDVIVVGAGLSGLQTAYDLQKAGLRTIVLEARDRVGGKTWTVPTANGKGSIDLGGAWINDTNQSKMWALAQKFGMDYIVQTTEGDCTLQDHGRFPFGELPPFETEEERQNFAKFRDLVEEKCQTIDIEKPWIGDGKYYDSMTFDEFAKKSGATGKTVEYANLWVRAMIGIDGTEISALYFLHYCRSGGGFKLMRSDAKHGGQHLRSKTGSQPYSEGLAALLTPGSVLLSTPVTGIRQAGKASIVTTANGLTLRSKKVVVSVPTPLYRDITFSPPLSGDKLKLVSSTRLGYFAKVILVYSAPWWTAAGLAGLAHSFNTTEDGKSPNGSGPITLIRDTSDPEAGVYALTCFTLANAGREWSKLPAAQRRSEVLAQVVQMYAGVDPELIYAPVEVFEMEWAKEEYSKGCPCPVTAPGILSTVGYTLREPFGNIHFVGTETSVVWKGYMEGAVRSGERGAAEVIEALGKEDKKAAQARL
ncbi:Amine oxidase [Niveomyces insectorum RCEF 264]|uniref:Amine oxidase n=1 Tax=Niveomyces insectorum RCEF 264 TaxID=1081102 RepID=A0A167T8J2_9HYPO|nr:Amine oxidase [Niveomyces insectorum RCEF 264]